MNRRRLFGLLAMTGVALSSLPAGLVLAQQCPGTSGTATINGTAWTAICVFGINSTECPEPKDTECIEIYAVNPTDPYSSVALFIGDPVVQGQTYALGGPTPAPNGAVVLGSGVNAVTDEAPYTGEVTIDVYNPGTRAIDCRFHFSAMGVFLSPDVEVTEGHIVTTLLPVENPTWTGVKNIYR